MVRRLGRHGSRAFFEALEERTLLSIGSGGDYNTVAPNWFDQGADQAAAVSFEFVGPLTSAQFEARSACFGESEAA